MALYSDDAFCCLNISVSVFSFYEAATDPIFPSLDLFEFSLQFGCGSQLKLRDDFVCVEIDAHKGDPERNLLGDATAQFYSRETGSATRISKRQSGEVKAWQRQYEERTSQRKPSCFSSKSQAGSSKGSSDLASLEGTIEGSTLKLYRFKRLSSLTGRSRSSRLQSPASSPYRFDRMETQNLLIKFDM